MFLYMNSFKHACRILIDMEQDICKHTLAICHAPKCPYIWHKCIYILMYSYIYIDVFTYMWRETYGNTHFEPAKHNNVYIYMYLRINSSIHIHKCISIRIEREICIHTPQKCHAQQCGRRTVFCNGMQCVSGCCGVLQYVLAGCNDLIENNRHDSAVAEPIRDVR